VRRIAVFNWEKDNSTPSAPAWRKMAKLAGKVAPKTAPWFWEQAGFDRDVLQDLLPQLDALIRESEERVTGMMKDAGDHLVAVPFKKPVLDSGGSRLATTGIDESKEWLMLPKAMVTLGPGAYALRISPLFVGPIFNFGDVIVIDPSQADALGLEGQFIAATYIPDAETRDLAERQTRNQPIAAYMRGRFPFLEQGVYLGWLKADPPVPGMFGRLMYLNSAKTDTLQPVSGTHEFSVPVAVIDEPPKEMKFVVSQPQAKVLGRVVCWMAAGANTPPDQSAY
jgi:hypothetical protein